MAPGRERQLNALAELQKYSPGFFQTTPHGRNNQRHTRRTCAQLSLRAIDPSSPWHVFQCLNLVRRCPSRIAMVSMPSFGVCVLNRLQWNPPRSVVRLCHTHKLVRSMGFILDSRTCIGLLASCYLDPTAPLNIT
jgi:hypothetical protein